MLYAIPSQVLSNPVRLKLECMKITQRICYEADSNPVALGWGLRLFISNKLAGGVCVADLETHFE